MNQENYKVIAKIIMNLRCLHTHKEYDSLKDLATELANYFEKEELQEVELKIPYKHESDFFDRKQFLKWGGVEE